MSSLLEHLEARRRDHKLLVPYLMAGVPDAPTFHRAITAFGPLSDAVEVGVPFSDPLMDGPVIASAGERALRNGVGPRVAVELVAEAQGDPPRVLMTYYNPIHMLGEERFCRQAATVGVSGLIVPDLPLEESSGLRAAAAATGVAWIPLVAPTSSPSRVAALAETCTGFVYAVSSLGVTGARATLSARAAAVAEACRDATDLPVLVGIGVSTPAQATEVAEVADGVVIGSALVSRLMESGVEAALDLLEDVRKALDGVGLERGVRVQPEL